jgi:hypothetical protein
VATESARALPLGAFAATLGVVGSDPARLVRQASEALLAGAGRHGVIVGVDDAHLLDELSAVWRCCVSGRWARSTAPFVRCLDGGGEFGEGCGDPVVRVEVEG